MAASDKQETVRLGFLTAIEVADRGFVGGLLITNHYGRPLEFQCTAPVKANRTQEILYGPTLGPYVLGELIGRTLLDKASIKVHVLLTERPEILDARGNFNVPTALVIPGDAEPQAKSPLTFGRQVLTFHEDDADDRAGFERWLAALPKDADLREPFERIREALGETTRAGMAA